MIEEIYLQGKLGKAINFLKNGPYYVSENQAIVSNRFHINTKDEVFTKYFLSTTKTIYIADENLFDINGNIDNSMSSIYRAFESLGISVGCFAFSYVNDNEEVHFPTMNLNQSRDIRIYVDLKQILFQSIEAIENDTRVEKAGMNSQAIKFDPQEAAVIHNCGTVHSLNIQFMPTEKLAQACLEERLKPIGTKHSFARSNLYSINDVVSIDPSLDLNLFREYMKRIHFEQR